MRRLRGFRWAVATAVRIERFVSSGTGAFLTLSAISPDNAVIVEMESSTKVVVMGSVRTVDSIQ